MFPEMEYVIKEKNDMKGILSILAVILAAVALVVAGTTFVVTDKEGPKGEQGLPGECGESGPEGPIGPQGPPGLDAPINNKPSIRLITQSGSYVGYFPKVINKHKFTYDIHVYVDDLDDDTIRVTFYYSEDSTTTKSWTLKDVFFGKSGEYKATAVFEMDTFAPAKKTLYWLVEAWDGSAITTETFSYTVYC